MCVRPHILCASVMRKFRQIVTVNMSYLVCQTYVSIEAMVHQLSAALHRAVQCIQAASGFRLAAAGASEIYAWPAWTTYPAF